MNQLSLVDLLSLSPDEQKVVRLLTRKPEQTLSDVISATGLSRDQGSAVISGMVNKQQLVEKLKGGERTFSVRYQFSRARVEGLPERVQAFWGQPVDTFLSEIPLTATLSRKERQALLAKSTTRWLQPQEVFTWQGRTVDMVCLLRQGLLEQIDLNLPTIHQERQYVTAGQWIGLEEMLASTPSRYTFTAVTECHLLLWPTEMFAAYIQEKAKLSWQLSHYLNQCLSSYRQKCGRNTGTIWCIEGVESSIAASLVATNLAYYSTSTSNPPRLLLWQINPAENSNKDLFNSLKEKALTFDLLVGLEGSDYPPEVQLNLSLKQAQSSYDLIVCDTGCAQGIPWLAQLRSQAHTRVLVSQDPDGSAAIQARWRDNEHALPGQKRLALLSCQQPPDTLDAVFQFTLLETKGIDKHKIVSVAPNDPYTKAIKELHRRLSLNHAVAIFVPSTIDVDRKTDNAQQVHSTLTFLGKVFGGATRSDGEGIWRAEDNNLVTEAVTIVRTFVTKQALDRHLNDVIDFATNLKHEMKQEAVAIDVDNNLILV